MNDDKKPIDPVADKMRATKNKADALNILAKLKRAKNSYKRAGLDSKELEKEQDDFKKKNSKTKGASVVYPRIQDVNEHIVFVLEQSKEDEVAPEDVEGEEDTEPQHVVAGQEPQSKEEAEIANMQARTREIQARIGEYQSPGGAGMPMGEEGTEGQIDPMTGQPMDPGVGGQIDPMTGQPMDPGMGGQIDPMTGMPMQGQQDEGPAHLKGLGDATDPEANDMMGMGGMGAVDPMTGMPMPDTGGKVPTTIGRLYLLKRIYLRLIILKKLLSQSSDYELTELRKTITDSLYVFKLVIQNLKTFKDKIDEIIVNYYMLVKETCMKLQDFYDISDDDMNDNNEQI